MKKQNESESVELEEPTGQETQVDEEGTEMALSPDVIAEPEEVPVEVALPALQPILVRLESLEKEVSGLAADMNELIERAELLPRQVRQLGSKVDDITESISQPRIRDLLGSFLLLYDLVDQMGRTADSDEASLQNYQVLRDQIAQALRVNGIYPISDAQRFDPAIHKPVDTIDCETPDEDGEIAQVYRTGFRTDRAILRYAEVVVKRYQSSEPMGEVNQ